MKIIFYLLATIALLLNSCNIKEQNDSVKINPKDYKEPLLNANKIRVQKEDYEISQYIKRHKWKMEETGTGLRFQIYYHGEGNSATKGLIAVINFKLNLLNGKECYSSEKDGTKEFLIGQGGVESGLEEGILLLQVGDKAKFILPSHLAHGLLGDNDKIPSHAVIIYDVELVRVK